MKTKVEREVLRHFYWLNLVNPILRENLERSFRRILLEYRLMKRFLE